MGSQEMNKGMFRGRCRGLEFVFRGPKGVRVKHGQGLQVGTRITEGRTGQGEHRKEFHPNEEL